MEQFLGPRIKYYRPEDIAKLIDTYEIPETKIRSMIECLDGAARQWHEGKLMTNLQRKKNGDEAIKAYRTLKKALGHLNAIPDEAWEELVNKSPIGGEFTPTVSIDEDRRGFSGAAIRFQTYDPNPRLNQELEFSEIKADIHTLNEVLSFAATSSFNPKGRQTNTRLTNWIREIRRFWVKDLSRQFTRDFTNGSDPISEAATFCVQTHQMMEPATPKSEIQQAMKKLIAEINDWKKTENS